MRAYHGFTEMGSSSIAKWNGRVEEMLFWLGCVILYSHCYVGEQKLGINLGVINITFVSCYPNGREKQLHTKASK